MPPDVRHLEHGRVWALDRGRLLPSTYLFNPTLGASGGSVWMAYRRVSPDAWLAGPRTLGVCRLAGDLQPDAGSNVDLSACIADPAGADRWHADPRFFQYGGRLWMSYHDNYRLYLAPLAPEALPHPVRPRGVVLHGRAPRGRERNWGFFDHGGALRAVYTIRPHIVLAVEDAGAHWAAADLHATDAPTPWDAARWGEPHGGSMPVRVGGLWFAFFQSATHDAATGWRHYHVGFYGFDAEPPHRVRLMSRAPVLDAEAFAGPRSFYLDWSVVYSSGALLLDGRWLVSLGIHDRDPALAVFDHDALLAGCAEV